MQTNEPAKLFVLRALAPTRLRALTIITMCLRAYAPYAPVHLYSHQ